MEQYSNSATRQALNSGSRLVAWGGECIGAFLDDLASARAGARNWRAMLIIDGDQADLFARRRGKIVRLAGFASDPAQIAAGSRKKLWKSERQAVLVRFCGRRAIVKPVTLPAGARNVAAAIIRNKVESLAPWPIEDAIWGYRVAGEPENGQFTIDVGITGRKPLELLIAALTAAGVRLAGLEIAAAADDPDAIAVDFQSGNRRGKARAAVRSAMAGIGFFAAVTGAYGAWQAVMVRSELNGIEARTAQLTAALRAQPVTDFGSGKQGEAEKAVARKRTELPVMLVLNGLTEGVPDSAWLNNVDYADATVTIAGRGVSIPGIIESLESSKLFANVNFAAPTQRDPESNADMFSISASIENASEATP